jgi:hypothetical protein
MRYVYPQRVLPEGETIRLYGRAARPHKGWLRVLADDAMISDRKISVLPERRLQITVAAAQLAGHKGLSVLLE